MDFRFDFGESTAEEKNEDVCNKKDTTLTHIKECRVHTFSDKTSIKYKDIKKYSIHDKTISYIDADNINNLALDINMVKSTLHSDLQTGIYEGGFKIWECTFDLLEYLEEHKDLTKEKRVLDLGCGLGLLGTYSCLCHASHVTFQDYNEEVIEHFTMATVACTQQNVDFKTSTQFLSGDWDSISMYFTEQHFDKFSLILSSETIYNKEYYSKLLNILQNHLSSDGVALFAAKCFYFGVGGGTKDFTEYLINNGNFNVENNITTTEGLTREILKITRT